MRVTLFIKNKNTIRRRGLKRGLVQVYTGDGKGKTTAALGLALRASGAGLRVHIIQFIKGKTYSELKALKKIKNITVEQCGRGCFIRRKPAKTDIKRARTGLEKIRKYISDNNKRDLFILDEVNIAMALGLIKESDIIELLKTKPYRCEIILTGRYCPRGILK
ncbi:MAG: cob(I)yrinic acid a,c-diamide adenosyltransferase, partial [Candidatus Omnitrophica bacterium]|nr:cob(I)yrinic acid a,c-diamide adenosyltransferase [Candidatus Omnitrophota bacterium]